MTHPSSPHSSSADEEGRRAHYGGFYGLQSVPLTGAPLLAVLGNCQAEALRIALTTTPETMPEPVVDSVRIPPVHEMTQDDLPHLDRLLDRLDVLVVQPVHDGYRGLPLGTREVLARLRRGASHVLAPNYFWSGLYPYQVLIRGEGITDPPVVPYHDVRLLVQAAGGPAPRPADPAVCRGVAMDSLAELQRRERKHHTVPISDVLEAAGVAGGHTVDHPGNPVLIELAARVLRELGLAARTADPGRELLRSVVSPLHPEVLEALQLPGEPRPGWRVDGESLAAEEVAEAQLRWYGEHPEAVALGCRKQADLIRRLGLTQ